ncbi:AAA family ATPase [Candidatus Mycobacterium wuenschmannii]|uniref:AAA family ATPase n=1 Tax=Candidatus Mycobacterium wuenschmannii TaxID=3027808 RepID=A0ABY8VVC4_9MYCO|nr:LuxR family transcriptional regulator [Candidatus Mycobacterium wuenschmannii]WIM86729.1 AAA family ATPase [Candidatus Mycobacterium wuenschmannii]
MRQPEPDATRDFLTRASSGPAGMVISGEAGIGKTTLLWKVAEEAVAQNFRVLSTCASPNEVRYAYAAVTDVLREVDPDVYADLPTVQRTALERVLLHECEGQPTDERIVATAFLSVVQQPRLAAPVLVTIDDAQWLDASSQAVFAFAARRLTGPVGIMAAVRTEAGAAADTLPWLQLSRLDSVTRLTLRPLSFGGVHALILQRLGHTLPRPVITRIHEISGGNPFFALELARSVADQPEPNVVDLPESLTSLVAQRIGRPDDEIRSVLLAASCAAPPTVERVSAITNLTADRVVEIIESPHATTVVELRGNTIQFCHPLFAHGIYTGVSPARRREMHRRLAAVVDTPELKARHLALSATTSTPDLLAALDDAARATLAQGAPAVAAELTELAIKLGGDTPIRRLRAAEQHFRAGALKQAQTHLQAALDVLPPTGALRCSALIVLAAGLVHDESMAGAVDALTEAIGAADEPTMKLYARLLLIPALNQAGRMKDCVEHARIAIAEADQLGIDGLRSQALAIWALVSFMYGLGVDDAALTNALNLEDPNARTTVTLRACAVAALLASWTGRLESAQEQMGEVRKAVLQNGTEIDILWATVEASRIEMWLGRYDSAVALNQDAIQRAEQIGGRHVMSGLWGLQAEIASHTGDAFLTRTAAHAGIDAARETGALYLVRPGATALGFLEVSLGNHAAALATLQPLIDEFDPRHDTEIAMAGWIPDAVEALSALGRADDAEPLVAALEHSGAQYDRPWMLAIGARGRCQLHTVRGDLDAAEAAAERAIRHHERLPMPFETARTQLLLGQLQRRRRRRQVAEPNLRTALLTFERLGTPIWAERARAELARLARPVDGAVGLTAAEQRIAERAAAGLSNKQIAAELFLAPKTVESNLSSVYRKLGIRSRTALAAALQPPTV